MIRLFSISHFSPFFESFSWREREEEEEGRYPNFKFQVSRFSVKREWWRGGWLGGRGGGGEKIDCTDCRNWFKFQVSNLKARDVTPVIFFRWWRVAMFVELLSCMEFPLARYLCHSPLQRKCALSGSKTLSLASCSTVCEQLNRDYWIL